MTIAVNHDRAARANWSLADFLASPAFYWLMLAVYLLAHIVLRLWETPNIGKNDVQEAVAAQGWALGYHPRNPPLHTWLLMSSYAVFGVGTLAHVVLKYVLLGATYGFAFLCARRLIAAPALAGLAALSLTLLTPFAWTVHVALTHTLLLAAVNLATLWSAIRLTEKRRTLDYALFGFVIGLGLLTKYSYALFFLPLLAAMLSVAPLRRALADWRVMLSVVIAALMFAPHAEWMLTVRFNFIEFLADKQRSAEAQPYLADLGEGVGAVLLGALSYLGPMALVAVALYVRARKQTASALEGWSKAVPLIAAYGLGLLLLDVVVLRATQFEERYFLCALLTAPFILFQWLDRRGAGEANLKWVAAVILLVALIGGGGIVGRGLMFHETCDRCWDEMPMTDLNRAIHSAGFSSGSIVADHYNVAGNLRLSFPDAHVVAANYRMPEVRSAAAGGQCLLVWNARTAGEAMPAALQRYLQEQHLTPAGAPAYVNALLLRSPNRMDRFAYWLVPNADGACRPR